VAGIRPARRRRRSELEVAGGSKIDDREGRKEGGDAGQARPCILDVLALDDIKNADAGRNCRETPTSSKSRVFRFSSRTWLQQKFCDGQARAMDEAKAAHFISVPFFDNPLEGERSY